MMEKAGKDKYWVLEEIQKNNLRLKVSSVMSTVGILDECSDVFLDKLATMLELSSVPEHELPKYTNTYHWFYTDIVAGANPDIATDSQTRKVIALTDLIKKTKSFRTRDPESTRIIPTGDGYAIGFRDNPEKPLLLAVELHNTLNEYNMNKSSKDRVDIRIGLHTGPVYPIQDLNNKENVWGPGIVYARRVMDLGRAKSILASDVFANDVRRLRPEFKKIMHLIGNYPIKHGEKISLYNVYGSIYGTEVGTKKNPIARRVQKSELDTAISETARRFYYTNIEIVLQVIDPKSMMMHHTLTWYLVNQYDHPAEQYFCYVDGDVPRDYPELNVKVTDEDGKELQIKSLNVNKPLRKEFFVQFNKPLKPRQKGRLVRLEYDWEEPDRHYTYRFGSDCKKFRYSLLAPREMPIKQRVAKLSIETGEATYASIPATVKYLKQRTEVEWAIQNIPAFDAYRFDW